MQDKIKKWVARGAYQVSRKYRKIFVPLLPEVCAADMLKEKFPDVYASIVSTLSWQLEHDAASYLGFHAPLGEEVPEGAFTMELSEGDFAYFRELTTGTKPWSPQGRTACPSCQTLGHLHAKWCTVPGKPPEPSKTKALSVEGPSHSEYALVKCFLDGVTADELTTMGIDPQDVTNAVSSFTNHKHLADVFRIAQRALGEVSRLREKLGKLTNKSPNPPLTAAGK